jgi:predicted RNA-binding protein with RPS1 domain
VGFYNKVKGLVHPSEAGLDDGADIKDSYSIGQVLKCTVIGCDSRRGLRLSLAKKGPKANEKADTLATQQEAEVVERADEAMAGLAESEGDLADAIVGETPIDDAEVAEPRASARLLSHTAANQVPIPGLSTSAVPSVFVDLSDCTPILIILVA